MSGGGSAQPGRRRVAGPGRLDTRRLSRLLVESSTEGMMVLFEDRVGYCNTAAAGLLGAGTGHAVVGRPIAEIVQPGSLPRLRALIAQSRPGRGAISLELKLTGAPDPTVALQARVAPVRWDGRHAVMLALVGPEPDPKPSVPESGDRGRHAVVSVCADGLVRSWNDGAETLYGRRTSAAVGLPLMTAVGGYVRLDVAGAGGSQMAIHRRADTGRLFPAEVTVTPAGAGHVVAITETVHAADECMAALLSSVNAASILVDAAGAIVLINQHAADLLGGRLTDLIGEPMESLGLEFTGGGSPVTECLTSGSRATARLGRRTDDPDARWLRFDCELFSDSPSGRLGALVTISTDEGTAPPRHVQASSPADRLTGLDDREAFLARLQVRLATVPVDRCVQIICVDLDNLRMLNHTLGHEAGDRIVRAVGQRLRSVVPSEVDVARIGGHTFALSDTVVGDAGTAADPGAETAHRIRRALEQPIAVSDRVEERVCVSIGSACGTVGAVAADVLRDANIAAYRSRLMPGAPYVRFESQFRESLQRTRQVEQRLHWMLAHFPGDLGVVYQPVVAADTGRIVGFEALVRWTDPELGVLSPAEFIPIAEGSEAIGRIGAQVLRTALADFTRRGWTSGLVLSVNVSRRELTDRAMADRVARVLREHRFPASHLCLEITERGFDGERQAVDATVHALRAMGVALALDDFGTGATSLSELGALPITYLKADRSFVASLGVHKPDDRMLESLVAVAAVNGVELILEGIETPEQDAVVRACGADYCQGYFYAEPAALDSFEDAVRRGASLRPG